MRGALSRYSDALLRGVADRWLRLRSKKSAADLIDLLEEVPGNAALIDKRLRDLAEPSRQLLALLSRSRQCTWRLGALLELLSMLLPEEAVADGMKAVFELLANGFFFVPPATEQPKLRSFEEWLERGQASRFTLFTHPQFVRRAAGLVENLPALPASLHRATEAPAAECDGLEVPLRLGLLWQLAREQPLRLTQQGDFFKRDADRLLLPALAGPWEGERVPLPNLGTALASVGLALGCLVAEENELVAGKLTFPAETGSAGSWLERVLALLPTIDAWNAWDGWRGLKAESSPFGTVAVFSLHLLAELPESAWVEPADLAEWIGQRHCFWTGLRLPAEPPEVVADGEADQPARQARGTARLIEGMVRFLAGWAFQLRLTQVAREADRTLVRLTPLARVLLQGASPAPQPEIPKTLLVQPNLEILAFRQGLTPGLIAELSQFADWKTVGAACTLEITPASVYRGLETGGTHDSILLLLQRHGTKELPDSVQQALRTWAAKRDRITVYSQAALLEFASADELRQALARGLAGEAISDRLLLVPNEENLELQHFRLLAARDYSLPPGQCVLVEEDGVSLSVDLPKADLLLDAEIERFAERVAANGMPQEKVYRVTPASLQRGISLGLSPRLLEEWFQQRTGQPMPPAVRLFLPGTGPGALAVQERWVLVLPSEEAADGLWQWPATRRCLQERLGPRVVAVAAEAAAQLQAELARLPWSLELPRPSQPAPPPEG